MTAVASFHGSCSRTMHLSAAREAVFPLLCPVREAEWLRGWEARILHSASGVAEPGCVFATHGAGGADRVWVVARHEAPRVVQFVVHEPGSHVTVLEIGLESVGYGTRATWTYTLTALDGAREADLRAYLEATPARLADLEARLDHFLRTGTCL